MAVLSKPPWPFYQGLGRFTKAEAAGCKFNIIPHNQFISGRAKLFSAKASPTAVLSRRGPMAVLSRPWPFYHGRSSQVARYRFEPRIANSILSFTISLSAAGPSHFQQKPAQWPFYQSRPAQWPFYQGLALTARKVAMFISLSKFYQGRQAHKANQARWPLYQGWQAPMADLSTGKAFQAIASNARGDPSGSCVVDLGYIL